MPRKPSIRKSRAKLLSDALVAWERQDEITPDCAPSPTLRAFAKMIKEDPTDFLKNVLLKLMPAERQTERAKEEARKAKEEAEEAGWEGKFEEWSRRYEETCPVKGPVGSDAA